MPQPWTRRQPSSRSNFSIIETGTAAPPAVMHRIDERSCPGFCSTYWSRPIHTVGTPALTVTRSFSISSTSDAGSALYWPA